MSLRVHRPERLHSDGFYQHRELPGPEQMLALSYLHLCVSSVTPSLHLLTADPTAHSNVLGPSPHPRGTRTADQLYHRVLSRAPWSQCRVLAPLSRKRPARSPLLTGRWHSHRNATLRAIMPTVCIIGPRRRSINPLAFPGHN